MTPRGCTASRSRALGRSRMRAELARSHLLYGEWLRRERRQSQARDQLRTAHSMFDTIGMACFAERAGRELRAAGGVVRTRPAAGTQDKLTPQEAEIARMARRRPVEPGDRPAVVHQRVHRPISPAEGLRQARYHLPQTARSGVACGAGRLTGVTTLLPTEGCVARPACRTMNGRPKGATMTRIYHRYATVGGQRLYYREGGRTGRPAVVLPSWISGQFIHVP